jgi:hypothetical protein
MASHNLVEVDEQTCSKCLKQQEKVKCHWERNKKDALWNSRPTTVNYIAAKKIADLNKCPEKLQDIFNHLKNNKYFNKYFAHEQAVKNILFEERIVNDFVDLCQELLAEESFRNDFIRIGTLDAKGELDAEEKSDFFKSLERKVDSGQLIFDTKYPVWVDPVVKDIPKPKKKNCIITVCAGEKYLQMFEKIKDRYEEYAKKCNADFVVLTGYTQGWWGLEKFRIKPFIEAYDRTCFLDSDIIIQKTAPNIFDMVPVDSVGIHDDWTCLVNKEYNFLQWKETERKWLVRSQVPQEDFSYDTHDILLNTGVVVTSKQHADIWTPMKAPFPRNHCDEQFWVEYLLTKKNYDIYRLPLSMNLQHWMNCFYKSADLKTTHFLHIAIDHTRLDKSEVFEEVFEKYAD